MTSFFFLSLSESSVFSLLLYVVGLCSEFLMQVSDSKRDVADLFLQSRASADLWCIQPGYSTPRTIKFTDHQAPLYAFIDMKMCLCGQERYSKMNKIKNKGTLCSQVDQALNMKPSDSTNQLLRERKAFNHTKMRLSKRYVVVFFKQSVLPHITLIWPDMPLLLWQKLCDYPMAFSFIIRKYYITVWTYMHRLWCKIANQMLIIHPKQNEKAMSPFYMEHLPK